MTSSFRTDLNTYETGDCCNKCLDMYKDWNENIFFKTFQNFLKYFFFGMLTTQQHVTRRKRFVHIKKSKSDFLKSFHEFYFFRIMSFCQMQPRETPKSIRSQTIGCILMLFADDKCVLLKVEIRHLKPFDLFNGILNQKTIVLSDTGNKACKQY